MKPLFIYLKNYRKLIFVAFLLAAVNQVFSFLDPIIFKNVIDNYVSKFSELSRSDFFSGVSGLLLAAVGVAFVSRVAKNFQDYYTNTITQRLGARIYSDGLGHSLELPYLVFEDQRSGETLGKLQKVRLDSEKLIGSFINIVFTSFIGFLFVIIYAFVVHWSIAVAYLFTVPLIGWVSLLLSRRIKALQQTILAETTALAGSTTESLRNIELVKSLGLSRQEIKRLNTTTERILELELKKVKYIRTLSFVQGTIINALRTSLLFLMFYLIYARAITFGQFFALWIYSFFLFGPLQDLGQIVNTYRETEASLKVFGQIMETPKELKPAHPMTIGKVERLEFLGVSFKHEASARKALDDVSFDVQKGSTIAFVGPSGAGKTTLVKLLVGLYRPQEGEIFYNDHSSLNVDSDRLREQIGLVTQDTQLFAGTIRENLTFVNSGATDEECMEALRKASAQILLARANEGLDTRIGEGGVKVSGGERQRLAIARALLRRPSILVFDEATSSLDSLTEEEISKTIRDVSAASERITILIAHRLSTIMHADRIFVLEKGKIVERGVHDKLVAGGSLYYAMWRQQIGEREAPPQL